MLIPDISLAMWSILYFWNHWDVRSFILKKEICYTVQQFKGESSVTEKKLSFATAELVIPSSSVGKLVKYSPPKWIEVALEYCSSHDQQSASRDFFYKGEERFDITGILRATSLLQTRCNSSQCRICCRVWRARTLRLGSTYIVFVEQV